MQDDCKQLLKFSCEDPTYSSYHDSDEEVSTIVIVFILCVCMGGYLCYFCAPVKYVSYDITLVDNAHRDTYLIYCGRVCGGQNESESQNHDEPHHLHLPLLMFFGGT